MTDNSFLINSAAISDRGLSEKRPQNEDSYLEMPNLGLFAVADGVGGAQAGDVASQMAMEILGEAFTNLQAGGDAEEMMRLAIERANHAIFQMSSDLPQLSTMATTIVALHLSGNIASIGHVGDSRLYRLDPRGSLYRETQDHSVVEEEVRAGRMTAAQAANHPSRNVISRALGAENTVEVDMKTIMFDPNTTFLLCSDGITRHISDFELRELLLSSQNPAEICSRMKEVCYSRGAEDNLTAVIIKAVGAAQDAPVANAAPAPPAEFEEATVAAARPSAANNASAFAPTFDTEEEIPTQNLQFPAGLTNQPPAERNYTAPAPDYPPPTTPPAPAADADTDEQFLMEEPAEEEPPAPVTAAQVEERPRNVYQTSPATAAAPDRNFNLYTETEKSGGGFGRLVTSFLLLVVGAILGAAGYYFWMQSSGSSSRTTDLKPQTSDVTMSSFENLRRQVEISPDTTISTYTTTTPRDAADMYLLGRARMSKGEYEDAKLAFLQARNMLRDYRETVNLKVLENDITMALTIVQNKEAQIAYEREKKNLPSAGGTTPIEPAGNSANVASPAANQ